MDRVAIFVDAGYLYAGGSHCIAGESKRRTDLALAVAPVVSFLLAKAKSLTNVSPLRIYWYDGALSARLTTDQQLLASSDNVKLRLGIVNAVGEQKGVDAKIITDMAELARNGAMSDAVLVGGDEDLRIGIELAQAKGVRVHLLTIQKSTSSTLLRQEADTCSAISEADIRLFLSVNPAAPLAAMGSSAPPATVPATMEVVAASAASFTKIVQAYLAELTPTENAALAKAISVSAAIPHEHDGRLLGRSRAEFGRDLDPKEKTSLRNELKRQLTK